MPLVAENGMDWMYANCSTTAQRGALDWWKKFRMLPYLYLLNCMKALLQAKEASAVIDSNSKARLPRKTGMKN